MNLTKKADHKKDLIMQTALCFENVELERKIKWKEELSARMNRFAKVADEYNYALSNVKNYLKNYTPEICVYSRLTDIVDDWVKDVCIRANEEANNRSSLDLTVEHLESRFSDFRYGEGSGVNSSSKSSECIQYIEGNFDFVGLEKSIGRAKGKIEEKGFSVSAEKLLRKFGLLKRGYYASEDILTLKQQKGRYLLDISHYGSWTRDRVDSLVALKSAATSFENESEVYGLVYCLQQLINKEVDEKAASNDIDYQVPSRTKVAMKDSNVSAIFFKEKIRFMFEPEVLEALISFINEYKKADTELMTITVE